MYIRMNAVRDLKPPTQTSAKALRRDAHGQPLGKMYSNYMYIRYIYIQYICMCIYIYIKDYKCICGQVRASLGAWTSTSTSYTLL